MSADRGNEKTKKILKQVESTDLEIPTEQDPEWYRAVAYLTASGATVEHCSAMLGKAPSEIKEIRRLERIKKLVLSIQKRQAGQDYRHLFRQMMPQAVDTLHEVLTSDKEKGATKLAASKEIFDRALGKAAQSIELNGGSMIRDLFLRLDRIDEHLETRLIEDSAKAVNNDFEDAEIVEVEAEKDGGGSDAPETKKPDAQLEDVEHASVDKWAEENL